MDQKTPTPFVSTSRARRLARNALCALAVTAPLAFFTGAQAAPPPASWADAVHTFDQERARCASDPTVTDRPACMKSAGAALDEAKRGTLDTSNHPFVQNKFARCEPLPADEKQDCIKRMQGEGGTVGNVQEGGIFRETVTVEPAK